MDLDDLEAELALLISQMEHQPEDKHELYLTLREKAGQMRAFGMPLPADFARLMDRLEAEFARDADAGGDGDGDSGGGE